VTNYISTLRPYIKTAKRWRSHINFNAFERPSNVEVSFLGTPESQKIEKNLDELHAVIKSS
jgi:hypothetical protein